MNPVLLPKPLSAAHESSGPIMVLGFWRQPGDELFALCVDGDGQVLVVEAQKMRIDWRYDWQYNQWVDVSFTTASDYEEEDGEPEAETPDYGGETVP